MLLADANKNRRAETLRSLKQMFRPEMRRLKPEEVGCVISVCTFGSLATHCVLGTLTKPTDTTVTAEQPAQGISDRVGVKQQRATLEKYRQTFLRVPKIENRKPVFVSCEVRDRLDEIVRRLGGRRMSVSGLIENLARHHLETYGDDIERWRKL